ncbi:MAG: ABC transporter permease, partial [Aeromonas sp.]|nr:ABC transporter permease [Aeromonas sp.]
MKRHTWPLIHLKAINWKIMVQPLLGVLLFLGLWQWGASQVQTSLGTLPGPLATASQLWSLGQEHLQEREKAAAFLERQQVRNAARLAADPAAEVKLRPYTGRPTFFDQIATSLLTVLCGFALATLIAIPCGVLLGMNQGLYRAANPVIQLLKPVSPLAWLPLITLVVSALYANPAPWLAKSFLTSALTVTLCSLWPTLINTAVGVAGLDGDLHNVSRVLRLSFVTHVRRIVLPGALP